jgi:hypothetical protein
MPRRPPAGDGLGKTVRRFDDAAGRLDKLEQPDAGQLLQAKAKIEQLIANIGTYVTAFLSGGFTAASATITGLLTAANAHITGTTTSDAGVSSTGVYNNLLTTSYRVQYINSAGPMGYVPSSFQFKQDIFTVGPDEAAFALHVVTYRYIQAVEQFGEDAPWEDGVLAEELHSLGFTWAVDYDDDGRPFGVKYERLILAYIPIVQDHEKRLKAAGL